MSIPNNVLDEYLDFRQYYDQLLCLFQDITGEPFDGDVVPSIIITDEDLARNMMKIDKNMEQMTRIVFEKSQDFIKDFHMHFKRMK